MQFTDSKSQQQRPLVDFLATTLLVRSEADIVLNSKSEFMQTAVERVTRELDDYVESRLFLNYVLIVLHCVLGATIIYYLYNNGPCYNLFMYTLSITQNNLFSLFAEGASLRKRFS